MLVSFIVNIDSKDFMKKINAIFKMVGAMNYSKKKIEILIWAKEANASKMYKIPGDPLVRIFPKGDLNVRLKACHGQAIFFVNERFVFPKHREFLNNIRLNHIYVGKNFCSVYKSYKYQEDCKCVRTASIMQGLFNKRPMHGRWGKLNKKEILRMVYRFDEIKIGTKLRLLWGWINGY